MALLIGRFPTPLQVLYLMLYVSPSSPIPTASAKSEEASLGKQMAPGGGGAA